MRPPGPVRARPGTAFARRWSTFGLVAVVVLLAACSQSPERSATLQAMDADDATSVAGMHGQPVAEPYRKPDVQLVDTRGASFSMAQDATKPVVLVFFGYTRCRVLCGTVLADIAAALRPLDPGTRQRVEVLFVSVDPARDTPEVLRDYLDRFDPTFVGLTGSDSAISAVARSLGVPLTGREPGDDGYAIGHGVQVIGFGRDGLARILWMPGTQVGDLRADVVRLASGA